MKTIVFSVLATFVVMSGLSAQNNCKAYFPAEVGTKLIIENYNGKGKTQGKMIQELLSVNQQGDHTVYKVAQTMKDKKGKQLANMELDYECYPDRFVVDMESFMNPEQKESYSEMKVEIRSEDMIIPKDPEPGQKLEDSSLEMDLTGDSPINITMKITFNNRKVEEIEEITTPAGTFSCILLTQDVQTDTGFMNIKTSQKLWYAMEIGMVRSESYDKNGKLTGYQELVSIE
jgi:uncharacterized protein Veg